MSVLKYFKNIPKLHIGRHAQCVIFFLICHEVPGEKKRGGPVARWGGDRPLSPLRWATGPLPGAGTSLQIPKKITLGSCRP